MCPPANLVDVPVVPISLMGPDEGLGDCAAELQPDDIGPHGGDGQAETRRAEGAAQVRAQAGPNLLHHHRHVHNAAGRSQSAALLSAGVHVPNLQRSRASAVAAVRWGGVDRVAWLQFIPRDEESSESGQHRNDPKEGPPAAGEMVLQPDEFVQLIRGRAVVLDGRLADWLDLVTNKLRCFTLGKPRTGEAVPTFSFKAAPRSEITGILCGPAPADSHLARAGVIVGIVQGPLNCPPEPLQLPRKSVLREAVAPGRDLQAPVARRPARSSSSGKSVGTSQRPLVPTHGSSARTRPSSLSSATTCSSSDGLHSKCSLAPPASPAAAIRALARGTGGSTPVSKRGCRTTF